MMNERNGYGHPQLFGRFEVMNGLRGLCLMWVMFVHMPSSAVNEWLLPAHDHWRFGVDFFLAISGFLVMRSLYQSHHMGLQQGWTRWQAVREFLIRRASRIFPSYYAVLALLFALAIITHNNMYENLKAVAWSLPAFPLFLANYVIPQIAPNLPHNFIILWSMSFQEQFYLLLALIFLYAGVTHARWILWAGMASIFMRLALVLTLWKESGHFFRMESWLHLNLDGISWACLAWIYYDELGALWSTRSRAWASSLAIMLGTIFVVSGPTWWSTDPALALLSTFKAPLLALAVRGICELESQQGFFARLLKSRFMGALGLASYEIYLLHLLVYGFVQKAGFNGGWKFVALSYPLSWAAGYVFYHQFGKRAQEWMKRGLRGYFAKHAAESAVALSLARN